MKSLISNILTNALMKSVSDSNLYNIELKLELFGSSCQYQCHEIGNEAHYFEFDIDYLPSRKIIEIYNELLSKAEKFNRIQMLFRIDTEPELSIIWDDEFYSHKMNEHEKNMRLKSR